MAPSNSRLRKLHDPQLHGGWVPNKQEEQWIQADFGLLRRVFAISTRGKSSIREDGSRLFQGTVLPKYWGYVRYYALSTSNFGGIYRPITFEGSTEVVGNTDTDGIVTHHFSPRIGRYVRLEPLLIAGSGGLRWEVYGCPYCKSLCI